MQRRVSMSAPNAQSEKGNSLLVKIAGETHSVGIDSKGSIFGGKENDVSLKDGDELTIDADHPIFSRRGPNQEIAGNHKEDGNAATQDHVWYPKQDADTSKYQSNDWPHIRADAFVTMKGVLGVSLDNALPVSLRARAAPVKDYQNMATCGSPGAFIAHQKNYQDSLHKDFSKNSILASHRSVGFEYEFTGHSLKDTPSHITLASSDAHSKLFGLKFELETDSGNVVEIGMPPFLVPNMPDGKPDKAEIQAIHQKMREAMGKVRDKADESAKTGDTSLSAFVEILRTEGLGTGWKLSTKEKDIETIKNIKIRKPTSGKLANDTVYSQMNISLTGDESGKLIASAKAHFKDKNFAEESAIGIAYNALETLATASGIKPEQAAHVSKALANTLAIPSILLQKEIPAGGDHDLSSAVKELFSVWVKDSLPNILATTSASKEDLIRLKDFAAGPAKKAVMGELDKMLTDLKVMPHSQDSTFKAWERLKEQFNEGFDSGTLELLKRETKVIADSDIFKPILTLAETLHNSMDASSEFIRADGTTVTGDDEDYQQFQDTYDNNYGEFEKQKNETATPLTKDALFSSIRATVEAEIDNMNALIGSSNVVGVPKTAEFQSEEFGKPEEIGVRKDTQLAHSETNPAKLRTSVAEVRSDPAMKHFFNT